MKTESLRDMGILPMRHGQDAHATKNAAWIVIGAIVLLVTTIIALAQEKPLTISWSAADIAGNKVAVPADGKISIVAFVRADQSQSAEALETIKKTVSDDKTAQIIVVESGPNVADQARTLAQSGMYAWPVVADADFEASGKMQVHVWPTTVIVRSDGSQAGHLAGMPVSYASDLQSYLDFANQKIDQTALDKRLTTHEVVQDDSTQAAHRHLQVALHLLESGNLDQAKQQLDAGLKLEPQNVDLLLGLARLNLANNQAKDALAIIDRIPKDAAPAWQMALLRGKAYVQQEKWDEAKKVLPEATKRENLNPSPGEAHYLLGLAFQHSSEWEPAAKEFRAAYESSPAASRR